MRRGRERGRLGKGREGGKECEDETGREREAWQGEASCKGREREAEQGGGGREGGQEEGGRGKLSKGREAGQEGRREISQPPYSHTTYSSSYPVHCPDLAESVHHPC